MDLDLNNIYYPVGDDYASCLRRLYNINGSLNRDGIVMPNDLDGTRRLYQLLGSPLDRIPTIHVGGTNGKGTTSFKIAQCLKAAGLKTGLFVSPHISSFRERVQVNNELISEEDVVEMLPKICKLCVEHGIPATLFEVTFALACLKFDIKIVIFPIIWASKNTSFFSHIYHVFSPLLKVKKTTRKIFRKFGENFTFSEPI